VPHQNLLPTSYPDDLNLNFPCPQQESSQLGRLLTSEETRFSDSPANTDTLYRLCRLSHWITSKISFRAHSLAVVLQVSAARCV
jgi:hypothetical protein